MCGIIGFASTKYGLDNQTWLQSARDSMAHRGPDSHGIWAATDGRVSFGHRRLSIVDTSELGAQPMLNEEETLSIVFNGEIYNHVEIREKLKDAGFDFRSTCDTEVALRAFEYWGAEFVHELNGMFSFAICDLVAGNITLGRDRAGEKPLYFFVEEETLFFASELKALMLHKALSKTVDAGSLNCFLYMGFVPAPRSIIRGVRKLQAGTLLVFDLKTGNHKEQQYWGLPPLKKVAKRNLDSMTGLLREFDFLFRDSVSKQLEADVPVGVLLSGGLDSSLVTAVASQSVNNLKTFNVRLPGYGSMDETAHARAISEHFETDHVELVASKVSPDLLLALSKQFDEPIIDSSMIPTFLVTQEVKKHCTVALGGDGADELFGGYSHYAQLLTAQKFLRLFPVRLLKIFGQSMERLLPEGSRGENWLSSLQFDYKKETPLVASYFNARQRAKLCDFFIEREVLQVMEVYSELMVEGVDLIDRATRTDFKTYMPEDILVKVDRASMLNSLEVRSPFLDYRIIEFAFSKLSSRLKVDQGNKKIFLKKYAESILPESFAYNRKQGFSIPIDTWLRGGELGDFADEVLLSSNSVFNRKYVSHLLKNQRSGSPIGEKMFGLIMFQLWFNNYRCSI